MDDAPPPEPSDEEELDLEPQFEFEDPIYWTEERAEELLRDVAKKRRRMTRSERRTVKKAAKFARYPVQRCELAPEWETRRFAAFALTREKPSGDVAFASGVVDLGCLGLKDGHFQAGVSEEEANKVIDGVEQRGADFEEGSPALAKKVLRHGVAFGLKNGFEPPAMYFALDRFLGDHDLSTVETKIPLGHRGKPILIPGPDDDAEELARTLTETVGANGFYTPQAAAKDDALEQQESAAPESASENSEMDRSDDGSDIIMPDDV